jgi:hypothetical protein
VKGIDDVVALYVPVHVSNVVADDLLGAGAGDIAAMFNANEAASSRQDACSIACRRRAGRGNNGQGKDGSDAGSARDA